MPGAQAPGRPGFSYATASQGSQHSISISARNKTLIMCPSKMKFGWPFTKTVGHFELLKYYGRIVIIEAIPQH